MGNYSDYEINRLTADENAKDDRELLLRKRYQAQTQSPLALIIKHQIIETKTDIDLQEHAICRCGTRIPIELHVFHIRDILLDEMVGPL